MKIKNMPLFYKIYFASLIIFAVVLIAVCIALNAFIIDYNKGIPETVSQKFFENTFINLDTDKIVEMSGITHSEFETDNDIKNFLKEQLSGELSYTSISSDDEKTKKYIVKSGEYKLASFSLTADENNDYSPSTLELHLPKSLQKQYKVLSDSTITINSIPVDESYISERTPHKNADYLPDGVPCPEWITYSISGLTKEPEVVITDRNGNSPVLMEDENGVFYENIIYDEQEQELIDRLLEAAKQYAKCMQFDASKASALVYFEKGTPLYDSIRTVENMFVWDHAGYEFLDEKVSEFMRYDDNTVSVRISFTHVLKMYGREDYRDMTDITFFARNVNGKYLIFDRYNN